MMIKKPIVPFILLSLVISCNEAENETGNADSTAGGEKKISSTNCYIYSTKNDTVSLKVIRDGENVTGTLIYNFWERDKNTGSIKGKMKDNVLIADYTFMSEGMQSVRQVAFKLEGKNFMEGYGDVLLNDSANFQNVNSLEFMPATKLTETDCK
jgi:hypothetical protein